MNKHIIILMTLIWVKNSVSVTYVPPNRIIEAVQNDRYIFGIEDDGEIEIARCSVTSDTGIKHSFPVRPLYGSNYHKHDFSADINENIVTDRGAEGLCQIVVSNVQDNGPKKWDLEAKDYDNEIVAKTTFTVEFYYKGPLLKYEIRIMEFSSFANYIIMPSEIKLVSCYVKMNNTVKIELDMHTPKTNVFSPRKSKSLDDLAKRVSSLGHGYCGFKYVNATMGLKAMQWSLTAAGDNKRSYRGNFPTRVDQKITDINLHSVRIVSIGTKYKVECLNPVYSPFCSIFNPAGHLVETEKCEYTIASFAMEHVGVWKCFNGFGNSMESLDYTIDLHGKYPERIIQWANETEDYVNIGCAVENYRGRTVNYCKMVAPNERIFHIQPYFVTERYLTLGTNFSESICSLMIKKPLQEYEKGLWRCEIKLEYHKVTGSYIAVGPLKPLVYPKHLTITTRLGEPFAVSCTVPYYSEYCRIRAPNGTVFLPDNVREVGLGRCFFHVQHSLSTDNGTWSCSYGRNTGTPDDIILVEVTIAEVLRYDRVVEVDVGDSAELMCTSGGLPLEYCRYISPTGASYFIGNHDNNPAGISYFGKGFEYGECGIRIPKVQASDKGYWTCVTKLVIDDDEDLSREFSARILMDVEMPLISGPNVAAIGIGSAIGIIIVVVIFGIVTKQKWNRRQHTEVEGTVNPTRKRSNSNSSSQNSGSNIFNMDSPPRPYRGSNLPPPTNNEDEEYNVFSLEELPHSSKNPGPSSRVSDDGEEQEQRL